MNKKVMIAAGGTGGHLFPAQALAKELQAKGCDVVFAGAHLSGNRYFNRDQFRFFDVPSATPFRRSIKAVIQALLCLCKGICQGCAVLKGEAPDLIVGFGSFHSFSVLCAARIKKIPYVLFESNALPGKVNRLFSKSALFTAVYFPKAAEHLQGNVVDAQMPVHQKGTSLTPQEARRYFGLSEGVFTIVVFGGSQGAATLNEMFAKSATDLFGLGYLFQVIHLAGSSLAADKARAHYAESGMGVCIKDFETRMDLSYTAASLVVARAGAATVAELIAYHLPSILIPFPHATDDHQHKNAEFLTNEVKASLHFRESEMTQEQLKGALISFLDDGQTQYAQMKQALHDYQSRQLKEPLCQLICQTLQAQ